MSCRHVVLTYEELDDLLRLVEARRAEIITKQFHAIATSDDMDEVLIEKDENLEFARLTKLQVHLEEAEAVYAEAQEHFSS